MTYNFRSRSQSVSYAETDDEEYDSYMMADNLRPVLAPPTNNHGNGRRRGRPKRSNLHAIIRESNTPRWGHRRRRNLHSRRPSTILRPVQVNERRYVPERSISSELNRMVEIDEPALNETNHVPESNNTLEQNLMMETDPLSINERMEANSPFANQTTNAREVTHNVMNQTTNAPEVTHNVMMEANPSSRLINVSEMNNIQEQNLLMETDPSSINERMEANQTSNAREVTHNVMNQTTNAQEVTHNVMMEENPSSRLNVSEMNNIQEHNLIMEPGPSSIPDRSQQQDIVRSKKTILAWLTARKAIDEGGQVRYKGGVKTITGRISNGGIICSCCDQDFSVWDFEKHNKSTKQQPYKNIFMIRHNRSLEQSIIGAWMSNEEQNRRSMFSYVPNPQQTHDSCLVCGDAVEGELICDKCPSTYHKSCANMQSVRFCEYWLCYYCRCQYCEVGDENEHLVTCCHCLKKFHWSCIEVSEKAELMKTPLLHCSRNCKWIYETMEGLIGIRNEIPERENISWSVIHQTDAMQEDIHVNVNPKVAVACMLINEAFGTIKDAHTDNNLVQDVMYNRGSNLRSLNFSRFYTFVLEKDDTIIAAAPIRFYGKDIAEMPFFAVDEDFRSKGFCRLFIGLIEQFLLNHKVEQWIISSTQESLEMWKEKFNFDVIIDRGLKRKVCSCNMLVLPQTIRLHKKIYDDLDLNMTPVAEV